MDPQFAAGLVAFVGICLIAGWLSGLRNRSYVGWLGLAFLALAGWVLAGAKAKEARDLQVASPGTVMAAKALLVAAGVAFVLAAASAVQETARRLRQIRESHAAAAEGLLELVRAAQEKEAQGSSEGAGAADGSDGPGETPA